MVKHIKILLLIVLALFVSQGYASCYITQSDSTEQKWEKHLFYKALEAYDNNELDYAMLLIKMLKDVKDDESAYFALEARIFEKINYKLGAVLAWCKANSISPDNWDYAQRVIRYLGTDVRPELVDSIITTSISHHPNNPDVWQTAGQFYIQANNLPHHYQKALDAFNHLERLQGISEYSTLAKAHIYSALNKKKKVVQTINRLITDNPDNDRYKVMLGDFYLEHGKATEAYKVYSEVLEHYPNNPYLYISLAQYYQQQGEHDKARQCLYNAIENPRLDYDTKIDIMSDLSERMKGTSANYAQYEKMLTSLHEQYPYEEAILGSQYALYMMQDRNAEAYGVLSDLLDINPKSAPAWQSIIELTTDDETALKLINQAINAVDSADVAQFMFYRAMFHMKNGDYEQTLNDLQICIIDAEKNKNYKWLVGLYLLKGDALFNTKKYDEAIINYENSIRLAPNNALTLNNYAYLLVERDSTGDLRRAERMSAKALELEPDNKAFLDTYAWILFKQGSTRLADFYMTKLINAIAEEEKNQEIETEKSTYINHAIEIYKVTGNTEMLRKVESFR